MIWQVMLVQGFLICRSRRNFLATGRCKLIFISVSCLKWDAAFNHPPGKRVFSYMNEDFKDSPLFVVVKATGFLLKAGTTLLFSCTLVCSALVGGRTPWSWKVFGSCLVHLLNLECRTNSWKLFKYCALKLALGFIPADPMHLVTADNKTSIPVLWLVFKHQ